MKLVVGLGNPGKKYEGTRHNVGFFVVDRLAESLRSAVSLQATWQESKKGKLLYQWFKVDGLEIELIKPQTFMNDSGTAVQYVLKKHQGLRMDDLFVVHDDLDIPLGKYKIQSGKGPKVHQGLQSIYRTLGSKGFWHIRIGIEHRAEGVEEQRTTGEEYVLKRFREEEWGVMERVIEGVVTELFVKLGRE